MSSQKSFRVARYVAACAFTALAFGAAAHAGDAPGTADAPSTTVDYTDLNLAKQGDAKVLYSRLQRASDRVCVQYKEPRDLRRMKVYNACYRDALARAVDSVGHASVQAVYAADENVRIASRSMKSRAST
ncbi:UrcA family protein [Peristeroidobacter agariperforans]|uniref:UrcA family protein n=1 Tax=Peristeroidobacter agariperforans TaxID=268404 RepID=UPI00101C539F|nr:UrcA family protein [Peristeroidobacter agariperforans]